MASGRLDTRRRKIVAAVIKAKCYTPDGLLASLIDANGNVLSRKTHYKISIAYSYDSLNRLASKTPPSSPVVSYTYDLAGRIADIRHFAIMPKGGHFAAFEQPALFVNDLRTYFRLLR